MANSFKSKRTANVGTSLVSVGNYTVPASTQTTVIGLTLSNTNANTILASVTYFDGTNDTYIVKDATIVPGGTIVAVGDPQKLVVEVGHSVRVKSSIASSMDVVMSILELT